MPMTSLGDFLVDQYLNDPATQEARFNGGSILFDPATEDPFTNAAVRERIFNALQGNANTTATMDALQSPDSAWQLGGSGYNASLNIPDAPDRNDGDFGDIMKFALMAGGLSGLGNMFAGNLGGLGGVADIGAYGGFGDLASMGGAEALSGAGTAGFDAITAADMAAGEGMLSGMGQNYSTFLGDLANGGVAGTANLDTVLPTQGTTVPTGQAATTTLPPGGGTLANVVGSGDIEDAQLGSDMLKSSGQTYQQFLDSLKTAGAYQFPWGQVIGSVMEAYGQNNYRDDLLEVMNRALSESDPFKAQRPRYFEPLYQAATQGVGGTPYGEAIANSTLRKLSSTGDAGYDITGLGANTLAKNLNSASLDYVKALTPLTGAGFQANTGAATNVGQQAAQAGMGQSGALGSAFSSIMSGNQPSSLERLFGGKQANQTFPQFLSSF